LVFGFKVLMPKAFKMLMAFFSFWFWMTSASKFSVKNELIKSKTKSFFIKYPYLKFLLF